MDLNTLQRKVQRTFGDDAHVFIKEQDIMDWVNDAQLQIVRQTNCLITEASVAASAFPWTMPTDMMKIVRILYGTSPLRRIDVESLDAQDIDLTIQAIPSFYYFVKTEVRLYPDPLSTDSTSVTIQYSLLPTAITVMANPMTIPIIYHEDAVRFCVARAKERNEDYRGMEVAMDEFNQRLSDRLDEADDPDSGYTVIRDDPNWWG